MVKKKWVRIVLIVFFSLLTIFLFSLITGGIWISPEEWWAKGTENYWIFWHLRLPRVLLGLLVGAGLGVSGTSLQGFFRNPLASEYTLGVSGAAGFGAYLISVWFPHFPFLSPVMAAWVCSLVILVVAYRISLINGKIHTLSLLLAGVVFNTLFASAIYLHHYFFLFPETLRALRWIVGSIQVVGYRETLWTFFFFVPAFWWLMKKSKEMNALALGEVVAESMGMDVGKFQRSLYLVVSLLVSVLVAQAGPVAFVGLISPHISRILVGSDFRFLIPLSALVGGALLVISDACARSILAPIEIPVGVFTGVLGSLFFLYLLWKARRS
ncbi:MAG: FecCD family ABC transporter permease [bacterium JZ-2024 1]